MAEEKEILTIEEVAEYVRLGQRSVYKPAKSGMIPAKLVLNNWRLYKESLRDGLMIRIMGLILELGGDEFVAAPQRRPTHPLPKKRGKLVRVLLSWIYRIHRIILFAPSSCISMSISFRLR